MCFWREVLRKFLRGWLEETTEWRCGSSMYGRDSRREIGCCKTCWDTVWTVVQEGKFVNRWCGTWTLLFTQWPQRCGRRAPKIEKSDEIADVHESKREDMRREVASRRIKTTKTSLTRNRKKDDSWKTDTNCMLRSRDFRMKDACEKRERSRWQRLCEWWVSWDRCRLDAIPKKPLCSWCWRLQIREHRSECGEDFCNRKRETLCEKERTVLLQGQLVIGSEWWRTTS